MILRRAFAFVCLDKDRYEPSYPTVCINFISLPIVREKLAGFQVQLSRYTLISPRCDHTHRCQYSEMRRIFFADSAGCLFISMTSGFWGAPDLTLSCDFFLLFPLSIKRLWSVKQVNNPSVYCIPFIHSLRFRGHSVPLS